jgi:hypothetical protein
LRENAVVVDPNLTLSRTAGVPRSGADAHLTPTKRKKKTRGDGEVTNYRQQGDCRFAIRRKPASRGGKRYPRTLVVPHRKRSTVLFPRVW